MALYFRPDPKKAKNVSFSNKVWLEVCTRHLLAPLKDLAWEHKYTDQMAGKNELQLEKKQTMHSNHYRYRMRQFGGKCQT